MATIEHVFYAHDHSQKWLLVRYGHVNFEMLLQTVLVRPCKIFFFFLILVGSCESLAGADSVVWNFGCRVKNPALTLSTTSRLVVVTVWHLTRGAHIPVTAALLPSQSLRVDVRERGGCILALSPTSCGRSKLCYNPEYLVENIFLEQGERHASKLVCGKGLHHAFVGSLIQNCCRKVVRSMLHLAL